MTQTILLTGSGGFVGKNLKEWLGGKYELFCPVSKDLDLTNAQKVDDYLKSRNIDLIIHCATTGGARGCVDPENCIEDNLAMVNNLLTSKKITARVILFGSGAAYAKDRELHKVKETEIGKIIPNDKYGISKMQIAQIAKTRTDLLCLNIFACYGKYEKSSRFPTYAITQNINNQPIIINKNVIFDYLYIDDLCKITEHFIKKFPLKKIINITPSQSISIAEIAKIVNKIGKNESKVYFKEQGMNFEYTGDNALLLEEIPNFDFTSIEQGLKELYDHIVNKYYSSELN